MYVQYVRIYTYVKFHSLTVDHCLSLCVPCSKKREAIPDLAPLLWNSFGERFTYLCTYFTLLKILYVIVRPLCLQSLGV